MLCAEDHGGVIEIRLVRTALARGPFWVRCFLVEGILVDSGYPATAGELAAYLRGRPPRLVVNTHGHEDHSGGNAALAEAFGAPVLAPEAALDFLRAPPRFPWARRMIAGALRPIDARPLGARVENGKLALEAIPTPGHADDHTAFFEPERRWLFSGDLFLGERVRTVHWKEDVYRGLESLRLAAALDPAKVFCAHVGAVEDGAGALRRKIAFWEETGGKIRDLAAKGCSEREIRDRLLGREHWLSIVTRGRFSKLSLVRAFLRGPGSAPSA